MSADHTLTKRLSELEDYSQRKQRLATKMARTIGAVIAVEAAYIGVMRLGGASVLTPDLALGLGVVVVWLAMVGVNARRDARYAEGEIRQLRSVSGE